MELQFHSMVEIKKLPEISNLESYLSSVFVQPMGLIWNLPGTTPNLPPATTTYTTLIEKHRMARDAGTRRRTAR